MFWVQSLCNNGLSTSWDGISHALPKEMVIAFPAADAMQDISDCAQDPPLPSFFASRLIIRLKF